MPYIDRYNRYRSNRQIIEMSASNSYNPSNNVVMKNYLFMMTTAAKAAIDTSIEMRRRTGKLNVKGLSNQDVKEEVSKYKRRLDDIHRIALREAKKHAKRRLSATGTDMGSEHDSEESSPPQKRVKRKRPRFDLSKYVSQKSAKRASAESDILELCEQIVQFLNDKYGAGTTEYKVVDSNKATMIKITRTTKGKEFTHCLIGKYEFDRTRQQKVKDAGTGEITRTETVQEEDHVVYNLYNDKDQLVKSFKGETVRKGDVLRANAKGGSAIPVPAIKGNIIDDIEDVKSRLSKQGIQNMPVEDDEDHESSEGEGDVVTNKDADGDEGDTDGEGSNSDGDEEGEDAEEGDEDDE